MRRWNRSSLGVALVVALLCAACGRGNRPPVYPAKGKVLVNGQPEKGVAVSFYHSEGWGGQTIVPHGLTDEKGEFVLTTFDPNDGAPAGQYKVTAVWPAWVNLKGTAPDQLNGNYADTKKSTLTAQIEPKPNVLTTLEIKCEVTKVDPAAAGPFKKGGKGPNR